MSLGWPLNTGAYRAEGSAVVPATSRSAAATAGLAPAKGAYTELFASTGFDSGWLTLHLGDSNGGAARSTIVDIAVGAAASEVVVLPDIMFHSRQDNRGMSATVSLPFYIPAGSRVAVRAADNVGGDDFRVQAHLFSADFNHSSPASRAETVGINAATALGTAVDPGAVAHTKGAYAQLTASTSFAYTGFILQVGGNLQAAISTSGWLLDLAIGAAASERIIIPDVYISSGTTSDNLSPHLWWLPLHIPANTRIAARAQSSDTDAVDRILTVGVTGVSN